VGVWAFAKSHRLRGDLLVNISVEKQSYSPDAVTPIRRPAGTLPQRAAHFERNDVTIIFMRDGALEVYATLVAARTEKP
jgi:hypothetical protein